MKQKDISTKESITLLHSVWRKIGKLWEKEESENEKGYLEEIEMKMYNQSNDHG